MIPYVTLQFLQEHFRVIDPEVLMDWEMSHHVELEKESE